MSVKHYIVRLHTAGSGTNITISCIYLMSRLWTKCFDDELVSLKPVTKKCDMKQVHELVMLVQLYVLCRRKT